MVEKKPLILLITAAVVVVALLIIIIVPMSFSYLDYDEYAFKRRRSTGSVDTNNVYSGGRHFVGPDYEFKTFKASAHFVKYSHIPIFTQDNLEVSISVELQYFVIKEDLKSLHDAFDIYYESIIENNAKDALKNSVTKFDTDEFISNRSTIQHDLYNGVRQRLSGRCCIPGCKKNCDSCKQWEKCDDNCKPRETCTKEDKGLFVEVRYLQLHDIDIPAQVNDRKLLSLIRDLEKEKEESVKSETIVRKQTELEVTKIRNNASEVIALANSLSKRTVEEASIEAEQKLQEAHNDGTSNLITQLGLTDKKHKASLNYLQSIKNHEKMKYSIDFNTLIQTSK